MQKDQGYKNHEWNHKLDAFLCVLCIISPMDSPRDYCCVYIQQWLPKHDPSLLINSDYAWIRASDQLHSISRTTHYDVQNSIPTIFSVDIRICSRSLKWLFSLCSFCRSRWGFCATEHCNYGSNNDISSVPKNSACLELIVQRKADMQSICR